MKRGMAVVWVALAAGWAAGCEEKKAGPPATSAAASGTVAPSGSGAATGSAVAASPAASSASASTSGPAVGVAPDTIAAQHVLVAYKGAPGAPKGVTRSRTDAKKRAEEVVDKAKAGTDFAALVADYSDDPASKDRLGSLGKFTREKMVKPFSDAAFALRVGEVSGVVESPFGFHVIKRNQ